MVKFAKLMDFTPHEVLFEKLSLLGKMPFWGEYKIKYYNKSREIDIEIDPNRIEFRPDIVDPITKQPEPLQGSALKVVLMRELCEKIEILKQRSLFE